MPPAAETVQLTASESACLDAVKDGLDQKTKIAIEAAQDLKTVAKILKRLGSARLIEQDGRGRWRPTEDGRCCAVTVVPVPERRGQGGAHGRLVPGSTAERLLNMLARPMRGAELVECLGVTPQRIRQLVVRLHAQGRVKLGDRANILHIVARSDDPSLLLGQDEERILSALPDDDVTTVPRLAAGSRMESARTRKAVDLLLDKGLVEEAGSNKGRTVYRLAAAGQSHFQRLASARRAEPVPLIVQSDRVRNVLSYLAEQGEARIRDARTALGIPQRSMNALMQYLKRKGLVRKTDQELSAPYGLTPEGYDILQEMFRRDHR